MTINNNPFAIDSDAADKEWLHDNFFLPGDVMDDLYDESDFDDSEEID
jgi:hypothetical protein